MLISAYLYTCTYFRFLYIIIHVLGQGPAPVCANNERFCLKHPSTGRYIVYETAHSRHGRLAAKPTTDDLSCKMCIANSAQADSKYFVAVDSNIINTAANTVKRAVMYHNGELQGGGGGNVLIFFHGYKGLMSQTFTMTAATHSNGEVGIKIAPNLGNGGVLAGAGDEVYMEVAQGPGSAGHDRQIFVKEAA